MDLERRMATGIRGAMIGRAAMGAPWIFRELKHRAADGSPPSPPSVEEQWALIRRHCRLHAERRGHETSAMHSMRSRLMAYSRGMPDAKALRARFSQVASLAELDDIIAAHLAAVEAERPLQYEAIVLS
jgi:tRNA-dihydrouridine synthase